MKLYSYFRSTAAYRVRIALNLKGLDAEIVPLNLVKGEQHSAAYRADNPQGLVPLLVTDAGEHINQSMAILEYLEATHPNPALLPETDLERARLKAFCYEVAADIHPLNNLRVLQYLEHTLKVDTEQKQAWYAHWIAMGFTALEAQLIEADREQPNSPFCFGESPTWADCVLIPQVFNAHRFNCDMTPYPRINAINEHCLSLDAFFDARPEVQPDAH